MIRRIVLGAALLLVAADAFAQADAADYQRQSQDYAVANDPKAALDAIERAVALEPGRAEFLKARGTLATWVGDYARAQDSYRRVLQLVPGDTEALVNLARVSAWAGKTDEAVGAYRRYLKTAPDSASVWLELARAESWRGNYAAALDVLNAYRARFGESTAYSAELAGVLARAGQPAKAGAVLEPLLKQDSENYDLNLTRAIALTAQGRDRQAFNALDDVRRLGPEGRDTRELERIVRSMLGSSIQPGGSFYSDSDGLQVQRFSPRATIAFGSGTALTLGYDREALKAGAASGLEQFGGETDARHDHGWVGVTQRLGAFTFNGQVGAANAEQHSLTTYAIGAGMKPIDALKLSIERSSGFFVLSPRTVGLGLQRLDHRVRLDWLPTVGSHVALDLSHQELSDGNRRWEVAFSPRWGVARTERLNLDLGVSAYQFRTSADMNNGYYDPRRYEFYSVVAYPYVKTSGNTGLGISTALGAQRDDSSSTFRFGATLGGEVTIGITSDWMFKASSSTTFNQRLASGAFQGYGASAVLTRRF